MAEKKTTTKANPAVDYHAMSKDDLEKALVAMQQDQKQATLSHHAGELINHRVLTEARKDIARIKTALRALDKENK